MAEPKMMNKVIGLPLEKVTKAVGDTEPGYFVRGFFTSDQKDELGDIITRKATERALPAYRRWGNIRYMHEGRPVGKVARIGKDDGLKWNEVEIKVIDPQAIFEVDNDLLCALSVGIIFGFDDFEILEDGGWQINDFKLAEISLVDHPANYDASLQKFSGDENFRTLARSIGVNEAVKRLAVNGPEGVLINPKKKESTMSQIDETPVVDETPAEAPIEEVAAETEPVTEPVAEAEPVAQAPAEEAPAEEVLEEVPAAEPAVEAEPVITLEVPAEQVIVERTAQSEAQIQPEVVATFAAAVEGLTKAIARLEPILARSEVAALPEETPAQAPVEGQPEGAAEEVASEEKVKALEEQIAQLQTGHQAELDALNAQLEELKKAPAARDGFVQETQPIETLTPAEEKPASEEPVDLRGALNRHFAGRMGSK